MFELCFGMTGGVFLPHAMNESAKAVNTINPTTRLIATF
jgi:hypothetical protein